MREDVPHGRQHLLLRGRFDQDVCERLPPALLGDLCR